MSKRNRSKERMEAKAILPMFNIVTTPGKRAKRMHPNSIKAFNASKAKGASRGCIISAVSAYIPAPITLAPVSGPTMAEIEAKYGRI